MESRNQNAAQLTSLNTLLKNTSAGLLIRIGACLILAALLAGVFYIGSSASSLNRSSARPGDQTAKAISPGASSARGLSTILRLPAAVSFLPAPPAPVTVTIYASDCTTQKTVFNLQDANKTVCAVVTGGDPTWRILWSDANNVVVKNVALGSGTSTFILTAGSSLGDWRVIAYEPFGGSVQQVATFTVIDAANPQADVSVSKSLISSGVSSGGQILFALQLTNAGPSAAAAVQLSDAVPANTTFVSFDQLSGPTFTCTNPNVTETGTTVCTAASIARGESATFVGTYQVGAVANDTVISNTATVSTTTPDPGVDNNSSTAEAAVSSAACQLATPSNITVDADPGAPGAIVTYATPTGTGDCGQTTTGEGGEIIPPISCGPASGSFFPAGTTTVICSAQTGAAVSFQVTVNNPGGLSISLNGASTASVECGSDFNDPGATAVNGTGQSVPVTVSYTNGFDPGAPAVGSYTATYTATEGANSVSTTRTINVADSQAPAIAVTGANPYKIEVGSCTPFTDPGATANDGCAGPKPVSSSISGPGGATSVNNNVAGTYIITYTATDGTHQATATRTVLVGTFPPDEIDQPPSADVPPTITLIGDDQITIECGTPFTDPGATAAVCGGSVSVTTTGTVDIHTPGTYSITYTATANSLTSTAVRSVTVDPDNTAPIITVTGANPMTVECHSSFTDPGAVAHDACAGDFAATPSGAVDPNTVGQYTITYNASDPSGHAAAPVTRTVNVVDTTPPTITTCPAPQSADANSSCQAAVPNFAGSAVATDLCSSAVTITQSPAAGTMVGLGPTTVTITAKDNDNNSSTCQTTFTVNDKTPPTITLNGAGPNPMYVECHTSFTDPGATAHDNCSADFAATATGSVGVDAVGTYTITYNASDTAGNPATPVTRTVIVQDTTKPVITLIGANPQYVECHTSYPELGATANDSCAGSFAATPSGSVNANVVGTYTINYNATDPSGNAATQVTRTVIVRDTLAPTITLNGQTPSMWPPNHKYQTFGVTNFVTGVNDTCDGPISVSSVVITKVTSDEIENGNGDGNTLNDIVIAANCKSVQLRSEREGGGDGRVYTIYFKVTDSHGNVGTATAQVVVQHNPGETAVDSGVHYTVMSNCP
jgi:uncharacterized repeat protein (TIGR01451 family)